MSTEWVLAALGAVTLASLVQTSAGVGFSMIAAPFLVLGLDVRVAIVSVLLLQAEQCAVALLPIRRQVPWGPVALLTLGGVWGTPVGVGILAVADPAILRAVIGVIVIVSGLALVFTPPRPISAERAAAFAAGFGSGVLNGSTGLNGPPVAVYLSNQGWGGDPLRAALFAAFLLSNLAALGIGFLVGAPLAAAAPPVTLLTPAVFAGVMLHWIAKRRGKDLTGHRLRTAIGAFVICSGCVSLAGALLRSGGH